jgi:hypothetical protein
MFNRRVFIATTFTGSLLAAGVTLAQDQAIVGIQTVTTYSADARITAVDPTARTVTVTYADGAVRTHNVSPAVANFSATRIGDMVSIGFEDRLSFVLSGRNTPTPRDRTTSVTAAASMGPERRRRLGVQRHRQLVGRRRRPRRRHDNSGQPGQRPGAHL